MITDRLLHLHVFKTGGFFFRGILRRIPGLTILEDQPLHMTYDHLMQRCQHLGVPDLPVVVFSRHPYTWYLGQWCWLNNVNRHGFRGTSFERFLWILKVGYYTGPRWPNVVTWTQHWQDMGADRADHLGRFENLYEDTARILCEIIPDLVKPDHLYTLMNTEEIHHPSFVYPTWEPLKGQALERFWTDKLRAWVQGWDGELAQRLGYTLGEYEPTALHSLDLL